MISTINTLLAQFTKFISEEIKKYDYKSNFKEIIQNFNFNDDLELFKNKNEDFLNIPKREQELITNYFEKDQKKINLIFFYNIIFLKFNIMKVKENFPDALNYFFIFCNIINGNFLKDKNIFAKFDHNNFENVSFLEINKFNYLQNDIVDILFSLWNLNFERKKVEYFLENFSIKSHNEKDIDTLLHIKATQGLLEDHNKFVF